MSKRTKVMVGYYYPWTNDAGIYLAREKGYYKEEGIDVEVTACDPGIGDTLRYLLEGGVDFGIFPTNRLLVLRENRPDVVAVAAVNQRGMETIYTVKGKGVESVSDLAGKTIALNPTPRGLAMVKHIAKANGVDPASLSFFDSGSREYRAAEIKESKNFNATFGSYWAWDILLDDTLPEEERLYWPVDEIGAPKYHSYLLGTTAKHAQKDKAYVSGFLRATERAYRELAESPLEAVELHGRYTPYLPERVIVKSLPLISSTWLIDGRWGRIREDYMREYSDWLWANGILANKNAWKDSYTEEFLPPEVRNEKE
jgi:NitT/TauT family transport system substrate-binding protein